MTGVLSALMLFLVLTGLLLGIFLTVSRRHRKGLATLERPMEGSPQSIVLSGAGLALLLLQWDMPLSGLQWLMALAGAAGLIALGKSLRQSLFIASTALIMAGMVLKFFIAQAMAVQLLSLVFFFGYECLAVGLYLSSTEPVIRQRLQMLMLWLGLLFGSGLLVQANAAWLTGQSLLQLISAYKLYSRCLDFREQFYFVQKQRSSFNLKPIQAAALFVLAALLLICAQSGMQDSTIKNAREEVWVYRTQDGNLDNLIVTNGETLRLNLAYPVSEAFADSAVQLKITETQTGEPVYEWEGPLDDGTTEPGSYWIIGEEPGFLLEHRQPETWTIEWAVTREDEILDSQRLICDPVFVPHYNGEGQYFKIENLTAGYGYFSAADVQARNTLQINILRFRSLNVELTLFDAENHPVISTTSAGTLGFGALIGQNGSGWGVNFTDDEPVRGEMKDRKSVV